LQRICLLLTQSGHDEQVRYSAHTAIVAINAMSEINLEKYFEKIGFTGPAAATLGTLKRLQVLHATAIPFENIDPLMGRPVSLNLSALSEKFLDQGRGGYCFEQNVFFQGVLQSLGFSVFGLAAVVQWNRPAEEYGPRIHMVLRVELPEGEFIADVGYGRLTLTSPLELVPTIEQQTTLEVFRLVPIDGEFQVQVKLGNRWAAVYQVSLQNVSLDDYAVYNWFTSDQS
jgi:N-hydroxyarylamine O-acetyltransferase